MLKHYVEFLYPGLFVSEASVEEIAERDVKKVELPDNCFGFCFFDRTVTVIDGQTLTGDRKNVSGWYYQGEKMTLEQVKPFSAMTATTESSFLIWKAMDGMRL